MTSSSLSKNRPLRSCFKVGNNQKSRDAISGLDAPSLQCPAALATLKQDEPYADTHCLDGVSTVPRVLVVSA